MSRGPAASGLTVRSRTVRREILDELEAADPRAIRSRRDLQRVNRAMGSCRILTSSLQHAVGSTAPHPLRLLELGAGDGSLALRLATRFSARWPAVQLTLLDRQALITRATGTAFAHLGWTLRPLTVDALQWARAATQHTHPDRSDIILANLFLHHFEEEALRELLSAAATRCDVFIACEPRRSLRARLGARLLPALGVSRDTLCDAVRSVHAGFRDGELSRMWPAGAGEWRLEERPAGLFSHLFVAVRRRTAP